MEVKNLIVSFYFLHGPPSSFVGINRSNSLDNSTAGSRCFSPNCTNDILIKKSHNFIEAHGEKYRRFGARLYRGLKLRDPCFNTTIYCVGRSHDHRRFKRRYS